MKLKLNIAMVVMGVMWLTGWILLCIYCNPLTCVAVTVLIVANNIEQRIKKAVDESRRRELFANSLKQRVEKMASDALRGNAE